MIKSKADGRFYQRSECVSNTPGAVLCWQCRAALLCQLITKRTAKIRELLFCWSFAI